MANFDAGAIEASLTLDRSQFIRELKAARAQADRFERRGINLDLTVSGEEALSRLSAQLESIEDERIALRVEDEEARLAIERLDESLDGLDNKLVDIDVNTTDALAEVELLNRQIEGLDETINIDVDESDTAKLIGTGRALNGTRLAMLAILSLSPAIGPAIAGATVAVIGLVGSLVAAGVAAGVFGGAVAAAIAKYKDTEPEKMVGPMLAFHKALEDVKDAWEKFGAATQNRVFEIMAKGLRPVAAILPKLVPIFNATADAIERVVDSLAEWTQGPEFAAALEFFEEVGPKALEAWLRIIGNLIRTIGGLIAAFEPIGSDMVDAIERITAGWAEWAKTVDESQGFKDFINFVRETGPKVIELFVQVGRALINIGKALAPFSGPLLDGLIAVFKAIGDMDTNKLGTLVVAIFAAVVAFQALSAAIAIVNVVMAANPVTLVIVALFALAAAVIYLWKTNEDFREAVIDLWNELKKLEPIAKFIAFTAIPWLVQGIGKLLAILIRAQITWSKIWISIGRVVSTVIGGILRTSQSLLGSLLRYIGIVGGAIVRIFSQSWRTTWTVIQGALRIIGTIISSGMRAVITVITGVGAAVIRYFQTMWRAIVQIFSGNIGAAARTVGNGFVGIVRIIGQAMGSAVRAVGNGISGVIRIMGSLAGRIASAVGNLGSTLFNAGSSVIRGLISGIQSQIPNLIGAVSPIAGIIQRYKGPLSKDRTLLEPAGDVIMGGLIKTMADKIPELKDLLKGITAEISGGVELVGGARTPVAAGVTPVAGGGAMTKADFIAAMTEIIALIRETSQPLIGEFNEAHMSPQELAEKFWFLSKGRG